MGMISCNGTELGLPNDENEQCIDEIGLFAIFFLDLDEASSDKSCESLQVIEKLLWRL